MRYSDHVKHAKSLGAETRPRAGRTNRLLSTIFFVSPLATSVAPRLTPFFFALVSIALIGSALRREMGLRQLLPRGQALQALAVWLLLAAYVGLNATWSVERVDGFGKAAMLAGLAIMSFAAVAAALVLDKRILVRAGLFFAAGAFLGGLFILIELLTDGVMTRTAMTWVPLLQPSAAKRIKVAQGGAAGSEPGEDRDGAGGEELAGVVDEAGTTSPATIGPTTRARLPSPWNRPNTTPCSRGSLNLLISDDIVGCWRLRPVALHRAGDAAAARAAATRPSR